MLNLVSTVVTVVALCSGVELLTSRHSVDWSGPNGGGGGGGGRGLGGSSTGCSRCSCRPDTNTDGAVIRGI
jgi:hypothetical protein